jgi:polysaccharide deacetylase 2 family uncharacterized protein YibQ
VRKILLITVIFLGFLPTKAVFTNFSNPEKKEEKIKQTKHSSIKKVHKKKDHKIKTAIIWQLPQREFLGKELNKEEASLIDSEALNRFIEAASQRNPEAYKIYRSNNKNSQLLKSFTEIISNQADINILNNYIETKNYKQEQQKAIVISEIKDINKFYLDLKKTYAKGSRTSKENYEELKSRITACCGLENFLYIENLLKREIHFEIFNT